MIDLTSINLNGNTNVISNLQRATGTNFSSMLPTEGASLDDIFEEASSTYGVPINLVKAVAKAESNFNADAVSSAGAQGVMQLMPATAQSLGVTDSFDAYQNIMGGTKYLGQLLDKYDGDVSLALAGYNAGMGNVAKYGGVPPFTETKNYIEKVMNYAQLDMSNTGTYSPSNSYSNSFNNSFNNSFSNTVNSTTNNSFMNLTGSYQTGFSTGNNYNDIMSFISNFTEFNSDSFLYFLELIAEEMTGSIGMMDSSDLVSQRNIQKMF